MRFCLQQRKDFMATAYEIEKIKERSSEYQKLCAMLRKQADDGNLQLSDDEIRKGADRLMGYVEFMIRHNSKIAD
jgi:hypothetical protein